MKKIVVFIACLAFLFSACKSDFKLTSNWKEQMVIFGLLDQADTVQYIRINRSFLGEGNAYTMAAVHDSLNYKFKLNVTLDQWKNGAFFRTLPVDTTTMIPQDPGTFANQPQVLYRVHTPVSNPLTDDAEYHLTVINPRTGYTATGITTLVSGVTSTTGYPLVINKPLPIGTAPTYDFSNTVFPFPLEYVTSQGGRLFEFILRFHYDEYYTNTTVVSRTLDKDFGQYLSVTNSGNEIVDYTFAYNDFDNLFAAGVTPDPNVYKRVFRNCEMIMYVASDEFNTYLSVSQPVSSITGDKPTYTNINNGVGLFSARYVFDDPHYNKPLSVATINYVVQNDPRICALHFADASGTVECP
jgi:hypothetical protein